MKKSFVATLRGFHYWMMENPRYWYLPELKNMDSFVCILASDINAGKIDFRNTFSRMKPRFLWTLIREAKERLA
jgi:hypothetical protein